MRRFVLSVCFVVAVALSANAQLAITEVMSAASTKDPNFLGPDFFELTNFGDQDIDLDGYSFSDNSFDWQTEPFTNFVIEARQSMIICKLKLTSPIYVETAAEFYDWWWGSSWPTVPPPVQFFYRRGFDNEFADEVWLRDPQGNVVDFVRFGAGTPGATFVYDRVTGEFGALTKADQGCSFRAPGTGDIGSPGCTSGRIPLSFIEQPASQTLLGCGPARLQVRAAGMPRPKYQWYRNDAPIEGATEATLELSEDQISGGYHVVLGTAFEQLSSEHATITVATNLLAPVILRPPEDVTIFRQQTAVLWAETVAVPCPNYQWSTNGVDIPGATGRALNLDIASDAAFTTRQYCVRIWNEVGVTSVCARVTITARPWLMVTEIMAWPSNETQTAHKDWFELTNGGTNRVSLKGYRYMDFADLTAPSVVSLPITVGPGESIIFVEHMSAAEFRQWWGGTNLPASLQIVTWHSWSLDNLSEAVFVWSPWESDPKMPLSSAAYADATEGLTKQLDFIFCDENGCTSIADPAAGDSVPGVNGSFRACNGGDVGSPGFYRQPLFLSTLREGTGLTFRCRVRENKAYLLSSTTSLLEPILWTPVSIHTSTGSLLTIHAVADESSARFYRLEEMP